MEIPQHSQRDTSKIQNIEQHNKEMKKNQHEMSVFMKELTKRFRQSKPLTSLFLRNGTLIHYLTEIPATENILFASRTPIFKGFRKVVTRQRRRRTARSTKPRAINPYNQETLLNPSKQIKVKKIFTKILNSHRKFERLQRREIEKQVEDKQKDMAMQMVSNVKKGGKVEPPVTETGQDATAFQQDMGTGKNANILERKLHNELGPNHSKDSSNDSDLSYHSSSIDEKELYSKTK